MVTNYISPSKWWRRAHGFQINFWPKWLAQALCPHDQEIMITVGSETGWSMGQCPDCQKFITFNRNIPLGTKINERKYT